MAGQDLDLEMLGRTRASLPDRVPDASGSPTHAPELAARVLADGRAAALDAPSVMHLQSTAGNASVSRLIEDEQAPDKVKALVGQGGGERLDPATAQSMGTRFGEDFSDVRIHQGGRAAESARAVNARAYTVGNDVVFGSGQFDPASPDGQRTLAHELTHVVQQREGAVSGSDIGGGIAVSHPQDRFERDASSTADRIMGDAGSAPAIAAQRHMDQDEAADQPVAQRGIAIENAVGDDEEEQTGSGLMAQREEMPEEDEEPGAS
jgi:hypothetical protein